MIPSNKKFNTTFTITPDGVRLNYSPKLYTQEEALAIMRKNKNFDKLVDTFDLI